MDGEDTTKEPTPSPEEKSSPIPTILVIAAVCAVVALLFLWPGGAGKSPEEASRRGGEAGAGGERSPDKGERAGVQARGYDEAQGRGEPRVNPAIKLPAVGMAPGPAPQPEEPPEFQSVEEENAWYEKKLEAAEASLAMRKKAVERLPKARERAEQAANPEEAIAVFEKRKQRVEENHHHAEKRVAELEKKLEQLRGGK